MITHILIVLLADIHPRSRGITNTVCWAKSVEDNGRVDALGVTHHEDTER